MNGPFRGLAYAIVPALVLWALIITGVYLATSANAAPACERRSAAHVAEHGGIDVDAAWHVSHGQLPTCDEGQQARDNNHEDNNQDDDKSRYCRHRWFC